MSVFIQKDPNLQVSDMLSSLSIELERVRYAHDLVLVSNSGEEVATSARLLGLWSPLVRVLASEGGRILLPDFPFSALARLPTLLIPGWTEEVLTKEEVQVLKALDIPIIDPTINSNIEVKLEPVEQAEMSYEEPQVEIKEESNFRRRPAKTHQPASDQPASREVQIGRIRTGIGKIEKIEAGRRSKSQQLSLKVLSNYLQELMAQDGITAENSKEKMKENILESSAQESQQNITFLSCEHCTTKFLDRRSLNMHQENDCKNKNDISENEKASPKKVEAPMKPKSLLKDCDLCQMKFLNDRSLVMHKKTEH